MFDRRRMLALLPAMAAAAALAPRPASAQGITVQIGPPPPPPPRARRNRRRGGPCLVARPLTLEWPSPCMGGRPLAPRPARPPLCRTALEDGMAAGGGILPAVDRK